MSAALHAEIIAKLVAGGFTAATATLAALRLGATQATTSTVSGSFVVTWPDGLPIEGYTGSRVAEVRPRVAVEVLFDLGADPNAGQGAALSAGQAIAGDLANLTATGRWQVEGIEHLYLDDDRFLVVRVTAVGFYEFTLT